MVRVLVTGASGFLGSHVTKALMEAGHEVYGTVRSLANADKVQHLYNLCPGAQHKLQLVEADLMKPESWDLAVSDMTHVVHVASPFPLENPRHEDEVIKPAVDGTLSVLRACAKAGTVKRVVLTSSCVAVNWSNREPERTRTEADWSDPALQTGYGKSKTLAERAAWDFVKDLPADEKFELAVVNPSLIMGPPLQGTPCSSMDIMKKLLNKEMPMIPPNSFPMVDVRDVALAHVHAMTVPEAAGHRHICSTSTMWFSEMAGLLKAVFGPQGYKIPTTVAPKFLLRIVSHFDSSLKSLLPEMGIKLHYNNTRMLEVLKVQPHDLRDTLVEMAYSLVENGFVKKTAKYRGPGGPEEREMYMKLTLS